MPRAEMLAASPNSQQFGFHRWLSTPNGYLRNQPSIRNSGNCHWCYQRYSGSTLWTLTTGVANAPFTKISIACHYFFVNRYDIYHPNLAKKYLLKKTLPTKTISSSLSQSNVF